MYIEAKSFIIMYLMGNFQFFYKYGDNDNSVATFEATLIITLDTTALIDQTIARLRKAPG